MTNDDGLPATHLLKALYDAWTARDAAAIAALFDQDDAEVSYLDAGEIDPWRGAPAVAQHVAQKCARHSRFVFKIHAPRSRRLADDLASVFAVVDRGEGTPLEAERIRVTLIARKRGDAWKICHYAEAPKAPLIELQAFYESVAAEGLESIPPRPWGRS